MGSQCPSLSALRGCLLALDTVTRGLLLSPRTPVGVIPAPRRRSRPSTLAMNPTGPSSARCGHDPVLQSPREVGRAGGPGASRAGCRTGLCRPLADKAGGLRASEGAWEDSRTDPGRWARRLLHSVLFGRQGAGEVAWSEEAGARDPSALQTCTNAVLSPRDRARLHSGLLGLLRQPGGAQVHPSFQAGPQLGLPGAGDAGRGLPACPALPPWGHPCPAPRPQPLPALGQVSASRAGRGLPRWPDRDGGMLAAQGTAGPGSPP